MNKKEKLQFDDLAKRLLDEHSKVLELTNKLKASNDALYALRSEYSAFVHWHRTSQESEKTWYRRTEVISRYEKEEPTSGLRPEGQ